MNDAEVCKGRYTKVEILKVIDGVGELLGARRIKSSLATKIDRCGLQISFLDHQLQNMEEKIALVEKTIAEKEEATLASRNTLLNMRAAKQTIKAEYVRFQEIERKSRALVEVHNKNRIDALNNEIQELEKHSINASSSRIKEARSRLAEHEQEKFRKIVMLRTIRADYHHKLKSVQQDLARVKTDIKALETIHEKQGAELAQRLDQEKHRDIEATTLEKDIAREMKIEAETELELKKLLATKEEIDRQDNPDEFIEQLAHQVQERQLGIIAKRDVLQTIANIMNEVRHINGSLEKGITEYHEVMRNFEQALQLSQERN